MNEDKNEKLKYRKRRLNQKQKTEQKEPEKIKVTAEIKLKDIKKDSIKNTEIKTIKKKNVEDLKLMSSKPGGSMSSKTCTIRSVPKLESTLLTLCETVAKLLTLTDIKAFFSSWVCLQAYKRNP